MIAFACGWFVLVFSWFAFNAMIFKHVFKITFEFANIPIVKDNNLRLTVM
jgi:hypothetical protein